jgi:exopolysaccharide biosynthesis polyprenyl glycosylphosphotransferase
MQSISRNTILFKILLIAVDIFLIQLGYLLAFLIKFGRNIPDFNISPYLSTWPWLTLSAVTLFYFYKLYGSHRWRWGEVFASLTCVVFFQALAAMALSFLFRGFSFPRTVLLTAPLIHLVLLALWRRVAWYMERRLQKTSKVIIVGQPHEAVALAEKLEAATNGIIKVAGLVFGSGRQTDLKTDDRNKADQHNQLCQAESRWPVLGEVPGFSRCLETVNPDQIFICSALSQEQKAEVVYACVDLNKKVLLVPDLYEIMLSQARLDQVDDVPVFAVGRLTISEEALIIKRLSDIALSLVALVITAPLSILAALAIKLDSPGPVFYLQKRLTLQGKPFNLYKFRTMVVNAEKESGPVLATENDPRITRVGRFLRRTRIDEIPQLFNVLKGDMSIVGPRPERPFFVDELVKETPEYAYRMNVKSGITGLAQIAGKYSTSPENKLKYDLLYTKSYSFSRDLAILLQTVKVILMKDRAS